MRPPPSAIATSEAFAEAQQNPTDSPLPTTPSSPIASSERDSERREATSQFETSNLQRLDPPVRIARVENDSRRADVDARVVDALLHETTVATDVARALAERVEVLERALQVRGGGAGQLECPAVPRLSGEDEDEGCDGGENGNGNGDRVAEDELRLQLRLVEAERDQARRIVRDVRAYFLDEGGSTLQQG